MKVLVLALLVVVFLSPRLAQADGGIVRASETHGPFVITIFSPSQVYTTAPAEVSVMVQDRETNQVVMDAVVELSLVRPNESTKQINTNTFASMSGHTMDRDLETMEKASIVRATRAQGANKLLYSANVVFPEMGDWSLRVLVRQNQAKATVDCIVPVAIRAGRFVDLWFYFALIPVAIALFALNQWLRRRSTNSIAIQSAQMNS